MTMQGLLRYQTKLLLTKMNGSKDIFCFCLLRLVQGGFERRVFLGGLNSQLSIIVAMLANKLFNSALKPLTASPLFAFSAKKKQIELTLRTPYRTIVQDFSGFSKIITKDLSSVVVIQNRTPAALHVLPPGFLKLKLNGDVKGVSDEYIHTGGWAIIHTDNSVEINLMDALEKKEIRADLIDKVEIKDQDTLAGKYVSKVRRAASKAIAKRLM